MTELFGHLHGHGEFSRLDGFGTAKQRASRAADLGQPFLAQTDHGTLSGALHHITACREKNIFPIVGVEAYYRPNRFSRMSRQAWHLILLAKNLTGWHNLLRIVSTAYAEQDDGGGFYQVPCVDDELLDRYIEGISVTSACFQSWLAHLIKGGDDVAVRDYVQGMSNRYRDDFRLEIMPHDFEEQRMLNFEIYKLSQEFSVPLVATSDQHFVLPEHAETQRVAKMMATNLSFSQVEEMAARGEDPPYMSEIHPNLYISSRDEMGQWFQQFHPDLPKDVIDAALDETAKLVQSFKPFLLDKTIKMPQVTKTDESSEQILSGWIDEGFERIRHEYPDSHWDDWPYPEYEQRINFEWSVLQERNAIQYMVMIGDLCRWMHEKGIRYGVRGSAAGCLISYLVGISELDPIPWGLLFERFLNPGRKGMPDIDVDVESGQRARVKRYIIDKYGQDHVADIITHERFQPKSVLQRLCRVFDVPFMEARNITDTIDIRQDDEETTLEELLPINEKLREFKDKYPHIWEHAIRLEGTVSNVGKHAAGVVITPEPITNYMALERGKKGDLVTSWADSADFMVISDNGFQKIDLLGLQNLERHSYACRLIKERYGIDVDLSKLSPARDPRVVDEDVMEIFLKGHTTGVFQFGSKGMTSLLKQISPDNVLDLTAANALYRPGPMNGGVTWDYGRIKRGDKEPQEWAHNNLVWPIVEETYGLIAYQEQVMELGKRLGGFTPAQADDLRKAMGKLYRIKGHAAREFMKKYRELWNEGTKKNGISKEIRNLVWDHILGFGAYGFNKSHSGYYSFVAYKDAWLKTHYPLEIYAAILTYPSGASPQAKQDFITSMVREAKSREIQFFAPDVNRSELGWSIDEEDGVQGLRFNLTGIKDCGEVASNLIIKNRYEDYESIDDLKQRCGSKVNKKVIDALTEAGAFDCFGARDTWSAQEIARCEKNRLRMVIKGVSETDEYADTIRPNIFTQDEVEVLDNGMEVIVGGEITKVERKKTKNGNDFANVTIQFEMNEWRCKFWQNELHEYDEYLEIGRVIMVNGKKDEWKGFVSVVAKNVCEVQAMKEEQIGV
jgi:DNA polymerase-3 subunit alpha